MHNEIINNYNSIYPDVQRTEESLRIHLRIVKTELILKGLYAEMVIADLQHNCIFDALLHEFMVRKNNVSQSEKVELFRSISLIDGMITKYDEYMTNRYVNDEMQDLARFIDAHMILI